MFTDTQWDLILLFGVFGSVFGYLLLYHFVICKKLESEREKAVKKIKIK